MTDQTTIPTGNDGRVQPVIVVSLLVAFIAVLGAYVWLAHDGSDPNGLVQALIVLLGLGAHTEVRSRQQRRALATIQEQTNGVLTRRIREGAAEAITEALAERDRARGRATPEQ